jgi:type II secretory pathway component PulK
MNTQPSPTRRQKPARGSAVIVVLALLAIMMILVTASFVAERTLGRELKQIEKNQLKRLEGSRPGRTNSPVTPPAHG